MRDSTPCVRCGRQLSRGGRNHHLPRLACTSCRDSDPDFVAFLLGEDEMICAGVEPTP